MELKGMGVIATWNTNRNTGGYITPQPPVMIRNPDFNTENDQKSEVR